MPVVFIKVLVLSIVGAIDPGSYLQHTVQQTRLGLLWKRVLFIDNVVESSIHSALPYRASFSLNTESMTSTVEPAELQTAPPREAELPIKVTLLTMREAPLLTWMAPPLPLVWNPLIVTELRLTYAGEKTLWGGINNSRPEELVEVMIDEFPPTIAIRQLLEQETVTSPSVRAMVIWDGILTTQVLVCASRQLCMAERRVQCEEESQRVGTRSSDGESTENEIDNVVGVDVGEVGEDDGKRVGEVGEDVEEDDGRYVGKYVGLNVSPQLRGKKRLWDRSKYVSWVNVEVVQDIQPVNLL
jgi:hypothetical protein